MRIVVRVWLGLLQISRRAISLDKIKVIERKSRDEGMIFIPFLLYGFEEPSTTHEPKQHAGGAAMSMVVRSVVWVIADVACYR